MVYLSLGSNLGDRFANIRNALEKISTFFTIHQKSIVMETKAVLPDNADESWNLNYLNIIIAGDTSLSPYELLKKAKDIEIDLGREENHKKWSPRSIDIDILFYHDVVMNDQQLTIPHKEIANRDFFDLLFFSIGYDKYHLSKKYFPENTFVLDPKIVGIINVTPDSFSDKGQYFKKNNALDRINQCYMQGAHIIELGAQSTRPNYIEISPEEEINRLSPILNECNYKNKIGIDTYFDNVIEYAICKHNIKWINDISGRISKQSIKLIANNNCKLVILMQGNNIYSLDHMVKSYNNLGLQSQNIIIDPGIGFGKTPLENMYIIKNIDMIRNLGCEVMLAHSRKSFMKIFSNTDAPDRDIETISISSYAQKKIEYLRVHNIHDHMRYFVAKSLFT